MIKSTPFPSPKTLHAIAGAALFALALGLRLHRLDMGFWRDEIITVRDFVPLPWWRIFTQIPIPNNHLLNTLLAKLSIGAFGEHEWSARLPSVLVGTLLPPAAFLIFRRRFSAAVSFATGVFLCVNFWTVWFSQDCRGYAGLMFFGLLGTFFFLQFLERGTGRRAALYAACAAAGCWFHLYGFSLIAGQALWTMIRALRGRSPASRLAGPALAAAAAALPYLAGVPQLYHYAVGPATLVGARSVNAALFHDTLTMLAGTRTLSPALILLAVSLAGLIMVCRRWAGLAFVYLSAAALLILFTLAARVFIYPRFLSFLIPVFMLSLAAVGELFPSRRFRAFGFTAAAALLIAAMLPGLSNYYRLGKSGLKEAAAYIRERHPGQEVLAYGVTAGTVAYYLPGTPVIEEETALNPAILRGKLVVVLNSNPRSANYRLIEQRCGHERIWLSAGPPENIIGLANCP